MRKHFMIATIAITAAAAFAAPAQAVTTANFDNITNTGSFAADGLVGSFTRTFFLDFTSLGTGTFTVTTASSTVNFTSGSFGGTNFAFSTCLGGLACGIIQNVSISQGLQQALSISGNAGAGGSFGGSIAFSPAAVPEPASWALLIGGFGLAGGVLRRRFLKVSFAAA